MVDYTARGGEEKKRTGCLGVILIILLILGGLAAAAYFLLPKVIAKSASGGIVYNMLPDEMKNQMDQLNYVIADNLEALESYGLDSEELSQLIRSVDFDTVETIIDDSDISSVANTTDLLDLFEKHVSVPVADLERIKKDYYAEISPSDRDRIISQFRDSPLIMRAGFNILKETLLNSLETEDLLVETEMIEEAPPEEPQAQENSSGSSTTKKKK